MVDAGGKTRPEARELTHDWEGFMACHSVGLTCRLHQLSQWLADKLAKGAVAWWLRHHPTPRRSDQHLQRGRDHP